MMTILSFDPEGEAFRPSLLQRLGPLTHPFSTRPVIIHYHIFKNAGSTVDAILRKNFGRACDKLESSRRSSRLERRTLLLRILAEPGIKVISSHSAALPAPTFPGIRFFSILFVRHPIDRIGSIYAFDRRQPEITSPVIRMAHELSLADYVRAVLKGPARVTMSNYQSIWISSRLADIHAAEATPEDLERAVHRLAHMAFFGLVESFDESLLLLQEYLDPGFGRLDLSYQVHNKSEDRKDSLEERLEELQRQLGPSLYQELNDRNALDLALYERATQMFADRIVRFRQRSSHPEPDGVELAGASQPGTLATKIRRRFARAFPKGTLRGRIVRALNWQRLIIQLHILRILYFLRNAIVLVTFLVRKGQVRVIAAQAVRWFRSLIEGLWLPTTVVRRHPHTFPLKRGAYLSRRQAERLLAPAAEAALSRLLPRLGMNHDAGIVVAGLRSIAGRSPFLRAVDDLLTVDEALSSPAEPKETTGAPESPRLEPEQNPRRRRILFICSIFPNPLHGGGGRVSNFIKILSEMNDIHLCTVFNPDEDAGSLEELKPYCRSILKLSPWGAGGNQAVIRAWLQGQTMDIVHYEWPASLENYDPGYGPIQIFTYMEAVSLRLLMDLARAEPMSVAWFAKFLELPRILRIELVDASAVQARIAVTSRDAQFFRDLRSSQSCAVINHGISMDDFALPDHEPEPNTLVYVGNFRHYPNADAMALFFGQIWPEIVRQHPDAKIYLVGANPPPEVRKLADGNRVIVTGRVPDIRPYIQKAVIGIAPLVTGAGLRGKVLEYAALRRTFVATSVAVTDLAFKDGADYLHADEPAAFAARVVELLKDPENARRMGMQAYEVVREKYDNRRLVGQLSALYSVLERRGNI